MNRPYQPHIDGLRAIAVTFVILYHAGVDFFSGGYVGVDVFFVISGYLIISMIHQDLLKGRFSFKVFIAKRIRRLFPNLLLTVLVTFLIGWVLLDTNALRELSQSIVATSLFSSNIFFQLKSGYFDVGADLKPLLHTWSLSVEEQFYIIFPLILYIFFKFGIQHAANKIRYLLFIVILSSFILNLYLTTEAPTVAFYFTLSRAWEFAIGGLIGILPKPKMQNKTKNVVSFLGFMFIVTCLFIFDETTKFPGVLVILPVLGSFLLIRYGQNEGLLNKFLTSTPLVNLGKLSYSLYLWHFPIFVYLRIIQGGDIDALYVCLAIILTILMGYSAYALVEKPFRRIKIINCYSWIGFASILSFFSLCIGLVGHFYNGFQNLRYDERHLTIIRTMEASPLRQTCHTAIGTEIEGIEPCVYLDGPSNIAMLGNSHGVELAYAISKDLASQNLGGLAHYTVSACPPSYKIKNSTYCEKWHNFAIEHILKDPAIKVVVMSYANNTSTEEQWVAYVSAIEAFLDVGKKIVLVKQVPYLTRHPESTYLIENTTSCSIIDQKLSEWRLNYAEQNKRYAQLELDENVLIYDPSNRFCENNMCLAMQDCEFLYYDKGHMSIAGASLISADIVDMISRLETIYGR